MRAWRRFPDFSGPRILRVALLGRLIILTAVLWFLAQLLAMAAAFVRGGTWVVQDEASPDRTPVLGGYERWSLPQVAVMLAAWFLTSCWLWRVRRNAEYVAPDSQGLGRSLVVTSWVTPVFMIWLPYEAFSDAVRPTVRTARGREAAAELPLAWWWTTYLVTLFLTLLPHGYVMKASNLDTVRSLAVAATIATAVSAVLWVRIVRVATAAQDEMRVVAEAVEAVRTAADARR